MLAHQTPLLAKVGGGGESDEGWFEIDESQIVRMRVQIYACIYILQQYTACAIKLNDKQPRFLPPLPHTHTHTHTHTNNDNEAVSARPVARPKWIPIKTASGTVYIIRCDRIDSV